MRHELERFRTTRGMFRKLQFGLSIGSSEFWLDHITNRICMLARRNFSLLRECCGYILDININIETRLNARSTMLRCDRQIFLFNKI